MNANEMIAQLPNVQRHKAAVVIIMGQVMRANVAHEFKADIMLKALEFFEMSVRKQTLSDIVSGSDKDIDKNLASGRLGKSEAAAIAQWLLALLDLADRINMEKHRLELVNLCDLLKEGKA